MTNRLKVQILGSNYYISTDCSEEEMRSIEKELNASLKELMESRPNFSTVDALIVLSLNLMDQVRSGERSADRLREQLTGYMEEASRAQSQLNEARRQLAQLQAGRQ